MRLVPGSINYSRKQNLLADPEGRRHLGARARDRIMRVENGRERIDTFYRRCGLEQ